MKEKVLFLVSEDMGPENVPAQPVLAFEFAINTRQQTTLTTTKGRFPNFTTKINILKSKLRPKLLI